MNVTEWSVLILCTFTLVIVFWRRHWIHDFLTRSTIRLIRRVVAIAGIVLLFKLLLAPNWLLGIGFAEPFLIEWILAS